MATPATCAFTGTPASIIARQPPQTEAIDDEPLLSVISETRRIEYWNSSAVGSTAAVVLLWALHPLQTETVACAAQRTGGDLLDTVEQLEERRAEARWMDELASRRMP